MSSLKKDKLLTFEFIVVCIIAIIQRTSTQMQNTTLPLYIQNIGFDKTVVGNVNALYSFCSLICRPFMGRFTDKYGGKKVLIFGMFFLALSIAGYTLTESIYMILLLRGIGGIAFSATTVALSTISVHSISESRFTEGIGYFGLSSAFAQSIGPAFSLALISQNDGYWLSFSIATLLIGISLLLSLKVKAAIVSPTITTKNKEKENFIKSIFIKEAIFPSILSFCVFFASSSISTFLATYTKEIHLTGVSLFFVLKAIFIAVSRLLIKPIKKLMSNEKILIASFVIYGLSFFLIYIGRSNELLYIAGIAFGIGYALLQTLLNAAAVINVPKEKRGSANALYYLAMDLGLGAGASVWGYFAEYVGTSSVYLWSMILQIISILLFVLFKKKNQIVLEKGGNA